MGMRSWSLTKYTTRNWPSYNTALKQRGSLSIWFDPEMSWRALATGKRGRQPEVIQAAIHVCLTMKVLFGMPLRRTAGFVESLLRLAGRDWKVPDYTHLETDESLPEAHGQTNRLPAGSFFDLRNGKISRVTTFCNLADRTSQVSNG